MEDQVEARLLGLAGAEDLRLSRISTGQFSTMGVKDFPLVVGGNDFSLYKEEVSNTNKFLFVLDCEVSLGSSLAIGVVKRAKLIIILNLYSKFFDYTC